MTDNRQERITKILADESTGEMRFWFLSFADPDLPKGQQFLGATVVRAPGPMSAVRESHLKNCNPGGQCQFQEIKQSAGDPPAELFNILVVSRDEVKRLDDLWCAGSEN